MNQANIFHLPDEVRCHIFSYLSYTDRSACTLVCQSWRTTARIPDLKDTVTLRATSFESALKGASVWGKALRSLDLDTTTLGSDIQHETQNLYALLSLCPLLNRLALLANLTTVSAIGRHLPHLQVLRLTLHAGSTVDLSHLAACKDLHEFAIAFARVAIPSGSTINTTAFSSFTQMRVLNLWVQLGAAEVEALTKLTALERMSVVTQADVSLNPLASLPKLTYLESGGHGLTDPSPTNWTLRELHIGKRLPCVFRDLNFLHCMPHLEVLSFCTHNRINPWGLSACTKLTRLTADVVAWDGADSHVFTNMANLQHLVLRNRRDQSDNRDIWLAPHGSCTQLTSLHVRGFRVNSIPELARCQHLQVLNIDGYHSDTYNLSALSACPKLRDVTLGSFAQFSESVAWLSGLPLLGRLRADLTLCKHSSRQEQVAMEKVRVAMRNKLGSAWVPFG